MAKRPTPTKPQSIPLVIATQAAETARHVREQPAGIRDSWKFLPIVDYPKGDAS